VQTMWKRSALPSPRLLRLSCTQTRNEGRAPFESHRPLSCHGRLLGPVGRMSAARVAPKAARGSEGRGDLERGLGSQAWPSLKGPTRPLDPRRPFSLALRFQKPMEVRLPFARRGPPRRRLPLRRRQCTRGTRVGELSRISASRPWFPPV